MSSKTQSLFEYMDPLYPIDFFHFSFAIPYSQSYDSLPSIASTASSLFSSSLYLGWNENGILGKAEVSSPFHSSSFPSYTTGDCVELFLDMRDNKKAKVPSSFCHAFVLFPAAVDGVWGREVTRFRGEDTHPLCEPSALHVEAIHTPKSYTLLFFLPEEILQGYAPKEFPSMGFAYRIHRHKNTPLSFPFSSENFEPLQHPHIWASASWDLN